MTIESELLVSVLKLTKSGSVQRELIIRDFRVPIQIAEEMLRKFSKAGLIQCVGNKVEASSNQRVKMAIHAVELGTDFERVCRVLEWSEFESIASTAFETSGFGVKRRFRFKWANRRWEIDILGCREPIVACVDCKHWHYGWQRSAIVKAVEAQVGRTQVLAEAIQFLYQKVGISNWKRAIFIPIVLSLVPGPFKFHNNVPIVPILQLRDFLNELPAHINSLTRFSVHIK